MTERLIDISRVIADGGLVYPGDDPLKMERHWQIGPDCPFNMTRLNWMSHFLTHLDPPLHFFPDGQSLDEISLERFMGEALVREVAGDCVRSEDIPPAEAITGKNLLFKTRNSKAFDSRRYDEHHVYLTAGAAQTAVERGVNLVGFDYLSVDRFGDHDFPVHRILLGAGVLILEGLDLSDVDPGRYRLIALPLRIAQGDGSPVRAVLLADQGQQGSGGGGLT